jgi:hypothetical protein
MEPYQQSCDCTTSALFARAMDLIDPPRFSSDTNGSFHNNNVESDRDTSYETHDDVNVTEPVKKVTFDEFTCFAPRTVTAIDAISAYDLLVHASSMSSSLSRKDLTQIAWSKLQNMADVYRALLVTSCLLLELLSNDTSAAYASHKDGRLWTNESCPQLRTGADRAPVLSPAIENVIFSTSRRCILLLQTLERICAAKSIAENVSIGASTNLFFGGGDDIHDYDRSEDDLVSNYDWHDDGHLPLPFCQSKVLERCNRSSVLHECCYIPIQQDPPCSRFEKNAWTRYFSRGRRLVSLNIDDHKNNAQYNDVPKSSNEILTGEGDVCNRDDDDVEPSNQIVVSEGNRKKRRRATNSSNEMQTAFFEARKAIVKEGFLLLSRGSCGAEPLLHDDERKSINCNGFIRVYCKLHPSGWLSIEDRSIRLKSAGDSPLIHRRKCLKYFIYSGTICQPCLPDGTMSFHFRVDAARFLGASMLINHECERKDSLAVNDAETHEYNLLFAVDDAAGSTFVDGCDWVNALSGAAAKAKSLRDQIHLEWEDEACVPN